MEITLCVNKSENNTIGKVIVNKRVVPCILKDDCSVYNPVFTFKTDTDVMFDVNYIYASDFDRYYFINEIVPLVGGVYEIHCTVDVLQSFRNEILYLRCIVDKQAHLDKANLYLDDGDWVFENRTFNTILNYPNGFNDTGEFILICAGG